MSDDWDGGEDDAYEVDVAGRTPSGRRGWDAAPWVLTDCLFVRSRCDSELLPG